ncbi:MAG: sigma 54-interacting transcriptional regulator [Pirellulales bacterium]|nr:sigma 54-interacting transcriptional regulator [Pirellulales bacterium]
MPARSHSMNLESLHAIATMVAEQRNVDAVLASVVESLVDHSDLALARIWLSQPGDICTTCFMQEECPDRTRCLHLVASAARPKNPQSGDEWYRQDGFYRRLPMGVRRIGEIAATGQSLKLSDTADDREWFARNDWLHRESVQSFSGHPLIFRDEILGVLAVFSRTVVSDQEFAWLRAFADNAAVAIANARAFEEIEALRTQLELENEYLRDEIRTTHAVGGIVGESLGLHKVLEQVQLVAATDTSVLILGESGVGKELIARAIHDQSPRADRPLVKVNCASIPRELFESEFFGHVQGAFTGATRDRAGRFELADGGTLFLDEVGEIPLDMQSKLLRILQEGTYERIGEETTRAADVRVVAATNRDLQVEVGAKRFRQDLFYRLSVFPIDLPPLRDRKDDIPRLAAHFLDQNSRKMGIETPKLRQRHIIELQQYHWPGNIRELQNVVERAVISSRSGLLEFHLPQSAKDSDTHSEQGQPSDARQLKTDKEVRALERQNLLAVLERCNWKISGKGGAAEFLGLHPATLGSRMRAMEIKRPQ